MKKKKKKRFRPRVSRPTPPERLVTGLLEVEELFEEGEWDEAYEILIDLERLYPNRFEVLTHLGRAALELQDMVEFERCSERLLEISPNDPKMMLSVASAYLANDRLALALLTFRRFLTRWPDHLLADNARTTVDELQGGMDGLVPLYGVGGEEGLELAALHDRAHSLLDRGRNAECRKTEEELLRRVPNFIPALNNISLAYWAEGKPDRAISTVERVFSLDPENCHALSNLVRFLCLHGRVEEAREIGDRLKLVAKGGPDLPVKKAEAFSYIGDNQAVLEAFRERESQDGSGLRADDFLLYHLAAASEVRLGHEKKGRKLWKKVLEAAPGLAVAQDNLDDLKEPVAKRHGPWPFPMHYWIPQELMERLIKLVEREFRGDQDEALARGARAFLREHLEVVRLIPILLDRGDPLAREFAFQVALGARTPEMLTALRDFALSDRGPDEFRFKAAAVASEAGMLGPGPTRRWVAGEWRDLTSMDLEVDPEPSVKHAPEVMRNLILADDDVNNQNWSQAEKRLKRALEIEPGAPVILARLADAYDAQGHTQEAEFLLREAARLHPENLLVRASQARMSLRRGELDQADEILRSIVAFKRLHVDEFSALCDMRMELCIVRGQPDGARGWFGMWEIVSNGNPQFERWRERLANQGAQSRSQSGRAG